MAFATTDFIGLKWPFHPPSIPGKSTANVYLTNDSNQDCVISIPDCHLMYENIPDGTRVPAGSTVRAHVRNSLVPGQSWFKVLFDAQHEVKINIGTAGNKTNAEPSGFADRRVAVMVASKSLLGDEHDVRFFIGPAQLSLLINSFIQSNLPAIIEGINTTGMDIDVSATTRARLEGLTLDPNDLVCSYGTVTAIDSANYNINTLFRLAKGSAKGVLSYNSISASFTGSLQDAQLLFSIKVGSAPLSVTVTEVQCSLQDYSIDSNLGPVLHQIFSGLSYLLTGLVLDATRLTALINDKLNQQIRDGINAMINSALHGLNLAATPLLAMSPSPGSGVLRAQGFGHGPWMSSPEIQRKTLSKLYTLGTHDSGAYAFTGQLSNVQYPDIAFLWSLRPDSAPVNGTLPMVLPPTPAKPLYLGKALYDYVVRPGTTSVSQAGDKTILEQLQAGIRWFDLRLYYDADGKYYLQHGLRGPEFGDVLDQLATFIASIPDATELIFFSISHTQFDEQGRDPAPRVAQVAALIRSKIAASNIFHRANDAGSKSFAFSSLANTVISDITAGSTKAMFLNTEASLDYPAPVTNTAGYTDDDKAALTSLNWAKTPAPIDVVHNVFEWLAGRETMLLKEFATVQNGLLSTVLVSPSRRRNLTTVDWFHVSKGALPMETIMALNCQ